MEETVPEMTADNLVAFGIHKEDSGSHYLASCCDRFVNDLNSQTFWVYTKKGQQL